MPKNIPYDLPLRIEQQILLRTVNLILSNQTHQIRQLLEVSSFDWQGLFAAIKQQKVFLWLWPSIRDLVPTQYRPLFASEQIIEYQKIKRQLQELRKLKNISDAHDYPFLLVKGLTLSQLIYDDLYQRSCGDLDLLMQNASDCVPFKNLLIDTYSYNQHPLRLDNFYKYHEFWMYTADHVSFEIKRSTGAVPEAYIESFKQHSGNITISDIHLQTFDLDHTFLHLAANVYSNAETRLGVMRHTQLRDYLDLKLFTMKYSDSLDWHRIALLAQEYSILPKVICVLRDMNSIFDHQFDELYAFTSLLTSATLTTPWKLSLAQRLFYPKLRQHDYMRAVYNRAISSPAYTVDLTQIGSHYTDSLPSEPFGKYDSTFSFLRNGPNQLEFSINIPAIPQLFGFRIGIIFISQQESSLVYVENRSGSFYYSYSNNSFPIDSSVPTPWQPCKTTHSTNNRLTICCQLDIAVLPGAGRQTSLGYNILIEHRYITVQKYLFSDVRFCQKDDPEEWFENVDLLRF